MKDVREPLSVSKLGDNSISILENQGTLNLVSLKVNELIIYDDPLGLKEPKLLYSTQIADDFVTISNNFFTS